MFHKCFKSLWDLVTIFSSETSEFTCGEGTVGHKKKRFSSFRSRKTKNKGKNGGVIGYDLAVCCVGKFS